MARNIGIAAWLALVVCAAGCAREPRDLKALRAQLVGTTPDEVRDALGPPDWVSEYDYASPADDASPDEEIQWAAETPSELWGYDDCNIWFNVNNVVMQVGPSVAEIDELNATLAGKSEEEVRQTLGEPLVVEERESSATDNPQTYTIWHYEGLVVIFGGDDKVTSVGESPLAAARE
jgi:hypothetical protein